MNFRPTRKSILINLQFIVLISYLDKDEVIDGLKPPLVAKQRPLRCID